MIFNGGSSSSTSHMHHAPAPVDSVTAQRLARLTSQHLASQANSPSLIRVLVAGDHPCLRASLKTMLELDPRIEVVGDAEDGSEMVKAARRLTPDVLLVDLDMRCCAGLDAVSEVSQCNLAGAIIALSIHDDEAQRAEAMSAGVSLILEKGVPYRHLISAIRLACASPDRHSETSTP